MKKTVLFIGMILSVLVAGAQQWKVGVIWPGIQFTRAPLTQPLSLDTGLQDKRFFRMDEIVPVNKVQTDFPGIDLQWESRQHLFLRSEFRISSTKFRVGPQIIPDNPDTSFQRDQWTVVRPMLTAECGYLFGHKKPLRFFTAAGISLSVFKFRQDRITSYGYDDYDASNYYDHFKDDPLFLSLHLRLGVQLRSFTLSSSFKTSLTPIDPHGSISKLSCWSVIEIGCFFYQSGFMGKKQYEEPTEVSRISQTLRMDLKKSGASTGLRLPFYHFVMQGHYVDAWNTGSANYLVDIAQSPEQRFCGEIFGNNVNALNSRKTWYLKNEYGFNLITILYKDAVRKTSSALGTPDTEERNDLVVSFEDQKHRYPNLFYSVKTGYRVKTGKKSFVYGDLGLRYQLSLKKYKEATEVPYLKKSLLWINAEMGFQVGHKGIQLGTMGIVGKPDAFHLYKKINAFYIGIYHEIYSR